MKILFLTLVKIDTIENQGIYTDLLRKFRNNGHDVTIVCPIERKYRRKTSYKVERGIKILSVWTTNIQKTNIIEKGITTLFLEFYFFKAIKKYVNFSDIDLILYSTPPITFTFLLKQLKKASNAKTYLLLKDIFPQNAVDLNLLKFGGLLYRYFRKQEKTLYRISDHIGCMSPANLNYVLDKNPEVEKNKLEVNPNSIELRQNDLKYDHNLYSKYNIPKNKVIFIFGGNLGAPQGIEYIKSNIEYCSSIKEVFFLIIGDGTEYKNLSNWIRKTENLNVLLIKELPKPEYDDIIKLSHVGLIFLNPQFTIPNFPSRLLTYLQNRMPVICATDLVTDIGEIAVENKFGYSCFTSDLESFYKYVVMLKDKELRFQMGENAFKYLIDNYDIEVSYNKIIEKIN